MTKTGESDDEGTEDLSDNRGGWVGGRPVEKTQGIEKMQGGAESADVEAGAERARVEMDGDYITVRTYAAPDYIVTSAPADGLLHPPPYTPGELAAMFATPEEIRHAIIDQLPPLAAVRVQAPAYKLLVHGVEYARDKVRCRILIAHTLIEARDADKCKAAVLEGAAHVAANIKAKAAARGMAVVRWRTLGLLVRGGTYGVNPEIDDDSDNWAVMLGGYYFLTPYGTAATTKGEQP